MNIGNGKFSRGGVIVSEESIIRCADNMKAYADKLRKEVTKEAAINNLIKIGVLEQDGKTITEHQRIEED